MFFGGSDKTKLKENVPHVLRRIFGRITDLFNSVQESAQESKIEPNGEKPAVNTASSPTENVDSSVSVQPQACEIHTDYEGTAEERANESDCEPTRDSLYNAQGFDCAGFTRNYYRVTRDGLLNQTCEAAKEMQAGDYKHACIDACGITESGLQMILVHCGYKTGRMEENIEACRQHGLITDDFASRLHGVRKLGNFGKHNIYSAANLTHQQAWFAVMQTLDFLSDMEIQLLWPDPLPELTAEWAKAPQNLEGIISVKEEE